MSLPPSDWTEDALDEHATWGSKPGGVGKPGEVKPVGLAGNLTAGALAAEKVFYQPASHRGARGTLGFCAVGRDDWGIKLFPLAVSPGWRLFRDDTGGGSLQTYGQLHCRIPKVVVGIFMLTPFLVVLGQFFLSLCLLGAVRLTGPEDTTFESVFRLAAYAQAPAVVCTHTLGRSLYSGGLESDIVSHRYYLKNSAPQP